LSEDPVGDKDSPNLYSFVAFRPHAGIDPMGLHDFVKRTINGVEFDLATPTIDEIREGELAFSATFVSPLSGAQVNMVISSHEGDMWAFMAKMGNPVAKETFEDFYGVPVTEVEVSALRLWARGLWHHKEDIVLATIGSLSMGGTPKPKIGTSKPRINLVKNKNSPKPNTSSNTNAKPNTSNTNTTKPDTSNAYHQLSAQKGYPGVGVTPQGGPTFRGTKYLYEVGEGQKNVVKIKLQGTRYRDFKAANEAAGFSEAGAKTPKGYTWHHVDDFNPTTGEATMELIEQGAHRATYTHKGSVWQFEQYHGAAYETEAARNAAGVNG
jgi:hypothetical protein